VVEPNITALAADRATPEQIEAMERILIQSRRIADQRFRREFMELDRRFHQAVAEASGNRVLVDVQRPLHERAARIWGLNVMRRSDGLRLTQEEHEAVFDGIRRGDQETGRARCRCISPRCFDVSRKARISTEEKSPCAPSA
jgi:DNA-binding FadR family transcriptional regulator